MSLGSALTNAREARGLSVEDVAASTRIRATLIRSIENDDYDACGGAVYARGHVRSIAKAVGLDPEPLLAEFDPQGVAAVPATLPGGDLLEAEHQIARRTRPQAARWGSVMAAALIVIIALTSFSIYSNRKGTAPTAAGSPSPAVPVVVASPPPAPTSAPAPVAPVKTTHAPAPVRPSPSPSGEVALVHVSGVTLRLNMTGSRSWFHVASSKGKTLFEGTLTTGQTKDFTDPKQIRVIVGAPKAVDLVVNGKDIGSLPETGNVGHVVFTPDSGKGTSHG